MRNRYVLPSAFAFAIALGLSFGPVQAAEGDMEPGAATPKMDTPSAAPDMGTPGARPNAMEERPGQSSAQPQGAAGPEGSERQSSRTRQGGPGGQACGRQDDRAAEGQRRRFHV